MIRIYEHLKEVGLNPHFPGQHMGICKKPYVVILESNTIPSISSRHTGQTIVDLIIYAPYSQGYVKFNNLVSEVRTKMTSLKFLRKTSYEGQVMTEDEKKAYTKSLEYVIQKKMEV